MIGAMMYFESEPGLLPLVIASIGIGLYLVTEYQVRRAIS